MEPSISVVIPVRNEAENIEPLFAALSKNIPQGCEVIVVYDTDDDPTVAEVRDRSATVPFTLVLVRNTLGKGPANALRAGFAAATGDVIVVVMADLSDDLPVVETMLHRVASGDDIVCGSRYMPGGRQIGGPLLKRLLSRTAGLSLRWLVGFPTRDPTNAFKMYRSSCLRSLQIEGNGGFEISFEITVKAWQAGATVSEVPATWIDRKAGTSKFHLWKWLPNYLRWYLYAVKVRLLGAVGRA
ncbi:MAG: glycosyltransferase [Candidatus Eremiobacteraeota bacterium]|nr:glycosyltransferase [Candidatus Eremiobacteraeota bacterium]